MRWLRRVGPVPALVLLALTVAAIVFRWPQGVTFAQRLTRVALLVALQLEAGVALGHWARRREWTGRECLLIPVLLFGAIGIPASLYGPSSLSALSAAGFFPGLICRSMAHPERRFRDGEPPAFIRLNL
jgi:hypothetical protein